MSELWEALKDGSGVWANPVGPVSITVIKDGQNYKAIICLYDNRKGDGNPRAYNLRAGNLDDAKSEALRIYDLWREGFRQMGIEVAS